MHVRNGMTDTVLEIGPGHTLRDAARAMAQKRVGAAVALASLLFPVAPGETSAQPAGNREHRIVPIHPMSEDVEVLSGDPQTCIY